MSKSIRIMNNFETVTIYFEKYYIYAILFLLILKVSLNLYKIQANPIII